MAKVRQRRKDRARWHLPDIEVFRDARGNLLPFEAGKNLPFEPRRVFFLFGVPPGATRGGHATTCRLALVAVQGSCKVAVGKDAGGETVALDSPARGLIVEPGEWLLLSDFSAGAVVAAIADAPYRPR